jgi:hypothetical protein
MRSAGQRPHRVRLEDRPDDGTPATMRPEYLWVAIEQSTPAIGDEERVVALVSAPYHAQVTTDTVIHWNGREWHVTGVQDPDGRQREMVVSVYEVRTP